MHCPACQRPVGLEPGEPDEIDLGIARDGSIQASYTISNRCAECGEPLQMHEMNLQLPPATATVAHLRGRKRHRLLVGAEAARTPYGLHVQFTVTCVCDPDWQCPIMAGWKIRARDLKDCDTEDYENDAAP
jgi:hypothetical protein